MRYNPFRDIYDNPLYKGFNANRLPDIVDIELTNHCNLNCKMCFRQKMTRLKGFMAKRDFETVAIECASYGIPIRLIGWGEPFLHPGIIEFCELAKNLYGLNPKTLKSTPLIVHITNNGQIITEKQMEKIVEIGVDSIIFSFQGASEKGYEDIRKGASYKKIHDNILKLVEIRGNKEKPFIHISSTMTNESKEEVGKFLDYWDKIVDSVGFGITQPLETKGYKIYRPCTEVFHKLTVKWDGQVSACCGDYDNLLVVGSIHKDTLFDIWNNSSSLKAIRTLLLNKKFRTLSLCKDCMTAYDDFL